MRILAFESSAKAASVALCEDRQLIAQYFQNAGLTHSRTLMKMAEDLLAGIDIKPEALDYIAVAAGPGSFTGIRIGVSATIGLAWGADKPVCGVSTLEAMAYHAEESDYIICPAMDARRSQVYNGLFENDGGIVNRLTPDRALSISELVSEAKAYNKPFLLIGDGSAIVRTAFVESGIPCRLPSPLLRLQSAWGVACASINAPKVSPDSLTPNYLRVSQAERERNEKNAMS